MRVGNRDALRDAIEAVISLRRTAEIVAALRGAGARCSELNDVAQMLSHEQVVASEIVADLLVEGVPQHKVVALPLKANRRRSGALRSPPALGADTDAVLSGLGYGGPEIARLRAAGVVS